MDENIKVLYDISVLGEGWHYPITRTGTFRVNEEILYALKASGQCDLRYSANNNNLYWYFAAEYLRHNPRFNAHDRLCGNKWLEAAKGLHGILVKTNNVAIENFGARTLNIFERCLVDPKAIAWAEIFHMGFYYPLPSQIKEADHLKKFLFVHDLVPILFPHLSTPQTTATLMYNFEEAHKNSWFLCNSHYTKKDLCEYLPELDPNRVFVLHLGASDSFYPCQEPGGKKQVLQKYGIFDKTYIISVCTFDIRKNLAHLIRCFKDLVRQEELEDLCLVLVGREGERRGEIFDELECDMKDRIIITGHVEDEELAPLYSNAIAFVTPSLYEGFSLPTLEAMQCGVPVITSNTSVFPEVVGDAGIMVDPKDKDALCQSILKVYKDETLRKSLSGKSIERSKMFSWTKCAHELVSAYRTVLRK